MRDQTSPVRPIEFKGAAMPVVCALLHTSDLAQLAPALDALVAQMPDFFSGDAAVLDLGKLQPCIVDWGALLALLKRYNLTPVAVRNANSIMSEAARAAGLAIVNGEEARPVKAPAALEPDPPAAPPSAANATLVVERPLRSGQRLYARGGDLIMLAMVSAGAEVMADGHVHVYAPLRGRALAGAAGDSAARILTTSLEAELVSVAGVYRTFAQGLPQALARRPAQVRLDSSKEARQSTLLIEPLATG